jgi:hypothetical protein
MRLRYPVTLFGHLQPLTDNIGLLRHAEGVVPLHGHGYYADDVASGRLVVCREPSQELVVLGGRYLYFLVQAQDLGESSGTTSATTAVGTPTRTRGTVPACPCRRS